MDEIKPEVSERYLVEIARVGFADAVVYEISPSGDWVKLLVGGANGAAWYPMENITFKEKL
jgi:hypothetical protein